MKALITDDSALARKLLQVALNQAGITDIDYAEEGIVAVSLVRENDYDIIFMDWNMPHMSGIEVVRAIREINKSVLIVMVTGLADELHIREAIRAGVNDYLAKPYKTEQAVDKIQGYFVSMMK